MELDAPLIRRRLAVQMPQPEVSVALRNNQSSRASTIGQLFGRPLGVFLLLTALGFSLRLGYGIARYRLDLVRLTGTEFIAHWDFDGLEHVLIAKALLSGKGYIVDDVPRLDGKHVRGSGRDAVFKAPLYQFFLAALFASSGFSFLLFFPVQALLGGLLSGFVGLIAGETFQRPAAAWCAGLAAAVHPALVNSASQPYNENLFFLLFAATLWTFIRWLDTERIVFAISSGSLAALWLLTRESALPTFAAMLVFTVPRARRRPAALRGLAVVLLTAALLIAPWTLRNYRRFGAIIPVACILGGTLFQGNNDCVAQEGLLTPFWAEGPCEDAAQKRRALRARLRLPDPASVVAEDRMNTTLATEFIIHSPGAYLRLCLRRLWTVLLPYNPRADQGPVQRTAFTIYWLAILPAGFISVVRHLGRPGRQASTLLAFLIGVNLFALAAVMVAPDLRYRVGVDLLLACFAGVAYASALSPFWARPWLAAPTEARPSPLPSGRPVR